MSAAPSNLPAVTFPHPWRRLRELAHVTLEWHDDGPMGLAVHETATVSLRRGMTWEERRCTLQHELLHLLVGPVPLGLRAKDEEWVRRETARRMIPDIVKIGDSLAWAHHQAEAAEDLGVDLAVLRYRLRHMSPMEKAWLEHRLGRDDAVSAG
jgi:hypothetical protein